MPFATFEDRDGHRPPRPEAAQRVRRSRPPGARIARIAAGQPPDDNAGRERADEVPDGDGNDEAERRHRPGLRRRSMRAP